MNVKKETPIRAWHFVGDTLRDGQPIPRVGEWLEHKGEIELCESGLHASKHPFDALQYAPGNTLCLVECAGNIEYGDDKLVCSRRKIVKRIDAEKLLRRFAADQALSVAHLWDMPDAVRKYLTELNPADRDAAWDAARDAARDAAWDAARDAARDAALAAAWAAARTAARDAAWAAAKDAARDAARDAFERMVNEKFGIK